MKTVVIGGGASGLIASYFASAKGNQVVLIEKNEKLGKKLYITGKGRCNVTNNVGVAEFLQNVNTNHKFLHSSINAFPPSSVIDFFENNGLKLKTERGNRVFPLSDKSSDVIKCLEKALINNNVDIRLNTTVTSIKINNDEVCGVTTDKGVIDCDNVIVCTGGVSYPLTGSTGDGYKFAKQLNHNIIAPKPALVGIELVGEDYKDLQGLSLKNVSFSIKRGEKVIYNDFGEMLFTHFGVSGPVVLSSSCIINKLNLSDLKVVIDLKPALDESTLDNRLIREFTENNKKSLINVMPALLPKSLIPLVLRRASVSKNKCCFEITKEERQRLIVSLKNLTFNFKKLRPIEEAIITSGGVDVLQVNPKTMESKLVKGLFFAGEVLDVDAFTGGFNLQIAFSTGFVAGKNA